MARPMWQGQIQISLVSLGVNLFPASTSARQISFHQIDRSTGERVHHRAVAAPSAAAAQEEPVEEIQTVAQGDIAKGYEYEKGKYVIIEPDELKKLRLPGQKTFEVVQFAAASEIDAEFYEKPYFVVPKDEAQARAMAIVTRAMRDTAAVGLGEITFAGREHLAALAPPADPKAPGLMLYLMRYETELRSRDEYYAGVKDALAGAKVDEKQSALARQLIEHYMAPFEPEKFKDDYEAAVRALVEAKLENKPLPVEAPEPKPGKVIDLMEALRASLERQRAKGAPAASHPAPAAHSAKAATRKPPASARSPRRKASPGTAA
jgi:DNA end-binding protein Ku